MRDPILTTHAVAGNMLDLIGAFADPAHRPAAAVALARHLGGDDLLIFTPDPELGVLLPAPGLRQTLPGAFAWQQFLAQCTTHTTHTAHLEYDGAMRVVHACAAASAIAVLVSPARPIDDLCVLLPVLPLLSALFNAERDALSLRTHTAQSVQSVARAAMLAQTLDQLRRRLESALADAHTARMSAEHANHAKSAFMATMSHELRTPLNAMIGYADLLIQGIGGTIPPAAIQKVERIGLSARHLLGLIDEILTFSKLEAGEETLFPEPVPLRILIDEVVALTEPLALGKGLRFDVRTEYSIDTITTDPRKLRQILLNLLGNAAKFTDHGAVTLHVGNTATDVLFTVRDSGIGIAADDIDDIFQPFFQSDNGPTRTAGGTGLGLTITRRLARLMGGDVAVSSQLGEGSTFTVRIPVTAPSSI